jgi:hypothetical protein
MGLHAIIMIISSGVYEINTTGFVIKLKPRHRFQANAVRVLESTANYFKIDSCRFGKIDLIDGQGLMGKMFEDLFPHLDVVQRTCLEDEVIELIVSGLGFESQSPLVWHGERYFSIAFAGWEG